MSLINVRIVPGLVLACTLFAGDAHAYLLGTPCGTALPACAGDVAVPGNGAVDVGDLLTVITDWGLVGPPRPNGDCAPLPNGDCLVNVADLLGVIGAWGPCPVVNGACLLPNDTCAVLTQAQCTAQSGQGWVAGANCIDTDNDRIPNAFELNNCSAASGAFVGTNPSVADTDGDLIKDGDEFFGTLGGLNLPAMGANPLRKNAFIEADWTSDTVGFSHTHRPLAATVNAIIAAFASAPVSNICGGQGVSVVIDYGQGGAFTGGNFVGADDTVLFDSEFNTYKAAHFAANRNGYFYYSLHVHWINSSTSGVGGIAELTGDDHIVGPASNFNNADVVAHAWMHEFGHNLNLRHGGNTDVNYKPNYNSIMNYRYAYAGVDSNCNGVGNGALGFSSGTNAALNEGALLETNGICSGVDIDWNENGIIDAAAIARNINCDVGLQTACGVVLADCGDSVCGVLTDFNDWAAIGFSGLNHFDFKPEVIVCDPRRPQ